MQLHFPKLEHFAFDKFNGRPFQSFRRNSPLECPHVRFSLRADTQDLGEKDPSYLF